MNGVESELVAQIFGRIVKSLRKGTTGLTQEVLAEKTDTDRSYPSLLEKGQRCPTLWVVIRYARALGIEPDLLVKLVMLKFKSKIR